MDHHVIEVLVGSIEEERLGYESYIESSPDIYRGGFTGSVSKDCCIEDSGLSFFVEDALAEACSAP